MLQDYEYNEVEEESEGEEAYRDALSQGEGFLVAACSLRWWPSRGRAPLPLLFEGRGQPDQCCSCGSLTCAMRL